MRRRLALIVTIVVVLGCSSTDEEPAAETPTTAATCDQGATTDAVEAAPVADVATDLTITSFDGTEIRAHWFPVPDADEPVPTVLMGPGWSLAGDSSVDAPSVLGSLNIGSLNEAGYNVLTWDPRGFGASTGAAGVNDPEKEGRDVQVLLDWVAQQPEARTDAEGDPRVGMVGGSYGGGIQLTVAGIDCRVDALVPNVAWHSLETALYPQETVKAGWSGILTDLAAGGTLDPHITSARDSGLATGTLGDEDREWFVARGPGDLVDAIRTPTLLLHGTVDTLFTLQEAVTNFGILRGNDVPAAMLWYCGGHGACLTEIGDEARPVDAALAWLARYLDGDEAVDTGPVVDVIDQDGQRWVGDAYPTEPDGTLGAGGTGGTLALTEASAAGPWAAPAGELLGGLVSPITPARADTALELVVTADDDALALGAPHLTVTYSGTAPDGPEPTRVFALLVDAGTGLVLGNQVTPVPVELDGQERTVEVDLEVVAHHLAAGDEIVLQLVATTPAYATPRLGGEITVGQVEVELPTTTALAPA